MRRALAGAVCLTAACALVHRGTPAGDALRARRLMVPVAGVSPADVPDTFRARRGWRGIHGAVDIVAPRGTPVVSADDGRVLRLRRNRKGGITLYATDPTQRFIYYYAHLQAYGRGITPGCRLVRGQVIGFVGTTGNAAWREPHLHFQVMVRGRGRRLGGEPIDPRPFFVSGGRAR
ncbi:MAG: M23 family metallopeptidase [Deltaproteobacteria bacterium]|nr:MAG: M23 family metallopeptidase [Deltaproteobacteria bacterium]